MVSVSKQRASTEFLVPLKFTSLFMSLFVDKPLERFLGLGWYHANLKLYTDFKGEIMKRQPKIYHYSAMTCKMLKTNTEELE